MDKKIKNIIDGEDGWGVMATQSCPHCNEVFYSTESWVNIIVNMHIKECKVKLREDRINKLLE
jgi:hypothetical protein